MSVPQFQASNVIVGSGFFYTAPAGTASPSTTVMPTDSIIQTAGYTPSGYTDDGVQFGYTPQMKDITVDEELSPIDVRLIGEKLEISLKLAEATLNNLVKAIAGSTLTINGAGDASVLTIGSPANPDQGEFAACFMGPAPGTEALANQTGRFIYVSRLKATAAVTIHYQRKDKVVYNVKFTALANSALAAGSRLCSITDFNAAGS
jgi:hypothetical protein